MQIPWLEIGLVLLLVVINASPWDERKQTEREAVLQARARETGCAMRFGVFLQTRRGIVRYGHEPKVRRD